VVLWRALAELDVRDRQFEQRMAEMRNKLAVAHGRAAAASGASQG
jgi:hypothetical protein